MKFTRDQRVRLTHEVSGGQFGRVGDTGIIKDFSRFSTGLWYLIAYDTFSTLGSNRWWAPEGSIEPIERTLPTKRFGLSVLYEKHGIT